MAAPVARLAVEAGVEPLALEGASEPQAPVEPAARPATRRRRSVRAASATAEAEQSKTEPEQSKTEESQSEIGAALEAASKSVRGTRRRSNRTTARKLAGTHELPTDEHGEVSAAAVLESLAAAIAGDATAEQVEPALASGDITREQEPESQPLAERQPVDETAPEVVGEPAHLAGDDAESAAEEAEPVTEWVPFADWADGRTLLGGRRPTEADLDYHLTTLFPPVRPRRWLEIRYLDAVPDDVWPAVVFTLVTLLDDARLSQIAWEATESVATAWDQAARVGLADPRLREAAVRCVQAAADVAPADVADSMDRLLRQVTRGRSAADDFADRVVAHGIDAAIAGLASDDRLKGGA